jgi:hypothetical protein
MIVLLDGLDHLHGNLIFYFVFASINFLRALTAPGDEISLHLWLQLAPIS